MVIFLGWFIICAIYASKLRSPKEEEVWLPEDTLAMKAIAELNKFYSGIIFKNYIKKYKIFFFFLIYKIIFLYI